MQPVFNIDRPKVSDEEINKRKDFDKLVNRFKQQSLQKAKTDKSWWKNKYIKYTTVIAGITVICTISYLSIVQNKKETASPKNPISKNTAEKSTPSTPFIKPPSTKLNIPYSAYKTSNEKNIEINHLSGSKIKIPKNAFVNKKGELLKGEVEILYREFHNQAEITASGIPMFYDSAGTKHVLESAGMFEIKGLQNGEPVFINPERPISVEFASLNPENRFNQYYLDTVTKNWNYIKRDNPVYHKKDVSTNQPASSEILRKKYEPSIAAIPKQLDSVKHIYTKKIDKLEKPAQPIKPNKSAGRPQFELEVDYKEFPELASFKNALFEIGEENSNFSKDLTKITWSNANISEGPQKGKNYWLTLSYKNRIEKLIVYPVLSGADYEQAIKKYEEKFEKYQAILSKRQAEEEKIKKEMETKQAELLAKKARLEEEYLKERNRLAQQSAAVVNSNLQNGNISSSVLSRVFEISNFGIYNSDCPVPIPPMVKKTKPFFTLSNSEKVYPQSLYVIEKNRNVVMAYNETTMNSLVFFKNIPYIMCLFSGGSFYIVNEKEIQEVVREDGNTFKATPLNKDINDITEFKKALGI